MWAEAKYFHEGNVRTHLNEQELRVLEDIQEPHQAQDELELEIVRYINECTRRMGFYIHE